MEMDWKPSSDMAIPLPPSELHPEITLLNREENLITSCVHLEERRDFGGWGHREDDLVCGRYM